MHHYTVSTEHEAEELEKIVVVMMNEDKGEADDGKKKEICSTLSRLTTFDIKVQSQSNDPLLPRIEDPRFSLRISAQSGSMNEFSLI